MPLISALRGRGRQISEIKTSLVYKMSSGTVRTISQTNPVSKNQNKKKKRKRKKENMTLMPLVVVLEIWQSYDGSMVKEI